jgi:hypothetical protein
VKSQDGLTRVLFIRSDKSLVDALDKLRRKWIKKHPGVTYSRSDVVRSILWNYIRDYDG